MPRYGIVTDLNRCTGCMTCVIACKEENLTGPRVWWRKILEMENETYENITYVPYACMHCDTPACVEACTEEAIYKRPDGIVLIDQNKCTGCRDCIRACPYGVITINPSDDYFAEKLPYQKDAAPYRVQQPGKSSKCTLCYHLVDQGQQPRCVQACPSQVLTFGDLDDPESPIRAKLWESKQLLASYGTNPKVSYIAPRNMPKQVERRVIDNPSMER